MSGRPQPGGGGGGGGYYNDGYGQPQYPPQGGAPFMRPQAGGSQLPPPPPPSDQDSVSSTPWNQLEEGQAPPPSQQATEQTTEATALYPNLGSRARAKPARMQRGGARRPPAKRRARKGELYIPDAGSDVQQASAKKSVKGSTTFFTGAEAPARRPQASAQRQQRKGAKDGDFDRLESPRNVQDEAALEQEAYGKGDKQKRPYLIIFFSIIQVCILGAIMIGYGLAPICTDKPDCNAMVGPRPEPLDRWWAKLAKPIREDNEWWRFVTPIFLHAGVLHILSNLAFQLRTAWEIEKQWGWWRVFIVYLVSGIGGNLLSLIFLPDQMTVGASGALFGMLGSMWADLFVNWSIIESPGMTFFQLLFMTIISVFLGMLPMVDNWAHVGGLITGFLMGFILVPKHGTRCWPSVAMFLSMVILFVAMAAGFWVFYTSKDFTCHSCLYLNTPPWEWPPADPNATPTPTAN